MPEAITTWRESLWIGPTSASLAEVRWITASPEIGYPAHNIDATSMDSDAMTYVPGLKDYSADLVWELNAQHWQNMPGNLRYLLSLDGQEVVVERRMPLAGVKLAFNAVVKVSMSGASPNTIQKLTLTVTQTSATTVSEYTVSSGFAVMFYSSSYVDGVLVHLSPCTAQTRLMAGGSIGETMTARDLAYVSARYGQTVSAPSGYTFKGWCDDLYGDGHVYHVGEAVRTVDHGITLYPSLEAQ